MVAAGSGPIRTLGALWASSLPSTSRPLVPVLFPRRGGVHTFSISSSFPLPTVTTVMGNPKCMDTASPPHSRAPPRAPPNRRPTVTTAAIAMTTNTTNTTKYHASLPVLNPATPVLPVQPPLRRPRRSMAISRASHHPPISPTHLTHPPCGSQVEPTASPTRLFPQRAPQTTSAPVAKGLCRRR